MSGSSESTGLPGDSRRDEKPLPSRGRLLGLDYGTRRLGIAVSDDDQRVACPLENYSRSNRDADARQLSNLAREYGIVGLVVGLPLHMGGEEGIKAREARNFGAWAAAATGLPVGYWDERLSSYLADEMMREAQLSPKKRKARLDKVAAQIMLQSYLDSRRSPNPRKA